MQPIISVENLGKKYRIKKGENKAPYRTLRETLTELPKRLAGKATGGGHEDFWALHDVSFDVMPGERVGIIGRNGAGKSTLLKLLSRITEPTKGKITLRGRVASLLEVGTGFHPELSGRENIYLNGAILGMHRSEIKRKFDEIVDFAGVEKFLDTPVKRYSSGMYVRLAFAVAAHLEPEILIVDEVLAVGDAEFQKKCLGKMEEVSKGQGRTVLFVTHNLDAMLSLCNKGIVLEQGSMPFKGSAYEGRQCYLDMSSSTAYSLEQHGGRGGSGGIRIDRIWLECQNIPTTEIYFAQGVTLCVSAQVEITFQKETDIQVAFGIDTLSGKRLLTVLSGWTGAIIDVSTGAFQIACTFDHLPFIPGTYLISSAVLFHGETLDSIVHCAKLTILPTASMTHTEYSGDWGTIYLPCIFIPQTL